MTWLGQTGFYHVTKTSKTHTASGNNILMKKTYRDGVKLGHPPSGHDNFHQYISKTKGPIVLLACPSYRYYSWLSN